MKSYFINAIFEIYNGLETIITIRVQKLRVFLCSCTTWASWASDLSEPRSQVGAV